AVPGRPHLAAWSPDRARVVVCDFEGRLTWIDPSTASAVFAFKGTATPASALAWSPDGTRVAVVGLGGTNVIYEAPP
ncbi:MAG: hypothetical protein ACRC33_16545, partial [Gemmataceae bacterium]